MILSAIHKCDECNHKAYCGKPDKNACEFFEFRNWQYDIMESIIAKLNYEECPPFTMKEKMFIKDTIIKRLTVPPNGHIEPLTVEEQKEWNKLGSSREGDITGETRRKYGMYEVIDLQD